MLLFSWFNIRVQLLSCFNILLTSLLFVYFKEVINLTPNHAGLLIWINLQITNIFLLFGRFLNKLEQNLLIIKEIENYSNTPQKIVCIFFFYNKSKPLQQYLNKKL